MVLKYGKINFYGQGRFFIHKMVNSKLWVKLGETFAKVSTKGCDNVYGFIKAVKKELPNQLGQYNSNQNSIKMTSKGQELQRDTKLYEISELENIDDEHPMLISVNTVSEYQESTCSQQSSESDLFNGINFLTTKDFQASKKRKTIWNTSKIAPRSYDPNSDIFELPKSTCRKETYSIL